MAVTATKIITIHPWDEGIIAKFPDAIIGDWDAIVTATGDGTGGAVNCKCNTDPVVSSLYGDLYYAVTRLHIGHSDTATAQKVDFNPWPTSWEKIDPGNATIVGNSTHESLATFDLAAGETSIPGPEARLILPLYLGRAYGGAGGVISVRFGTNTNAKYYRMTIGGFVWRYLPFAWLYQQSRA